MTDDLPIKFTVNGDDIVLEWDENDPRAIELGCNDWTEADWLAALEKGLEMDGEAEVEVSE